MINQMTKNTRDKMIFLYFNLNETCGREKRTVDPDNE